MKATDELQRPALSPVLISAEEPALSRSNVILSDSEGPEPEQGEGEGLAKGLSKGCLIFGIASLLIMLLIFGAIAMTVGRFLISTDSLSPADAIVVLSGDNSDFTRARYAVYLFQKGYAPTAVFSSASSMKADLPCSRAQQTLQVARTLGLPADVATLIYDARSTYEEAVELRGLAQQHGWRSLIVVTDPFHTRRAGRTFRALLPGVTISVSPSPDPYYDASRWWQDEYSLVAVFTEVIKLAFYWAKYGIAPIEI